VKNQVFGSRNRGTARFNYGRRSDKIAFADNSFSFFLNAPQPARASFCRAPLPNGKQNLI